MASLARRTGPVSRVRVSEHTSDGAREREDAVAAEEPLEIRLAWPGLPPRRAWVTMRTPGHDFELAAGWAVHEGLVGAERHFGGRLLHRRRPRSGAGVQRGDPHSRRPVDLVHRHAGCPAVRRRAGSAARTASRRCWRRCGAAWEGPPPPPDVVRRLPALMAQGQTVFAATGGVHAAGLFTADGDPHVVREDVGRHNAVDKVTGARLLAGHPPAAAYLVVSGRAGFRAGAEGRRRRRRQPGRCRRADLALRPPGAARPSSACSASPAPSAPSATPEPRRVVI